MTHILDFLEMNPDKIFTARQIMDALDLNRNTTFNKLRMIRKYKQAVVHVVKWNNKDVYGYQYKED